MGSRGHSGLDIRYVDQDEALRLADDPRVMALIHFGRPQGLSDNGPSLQIHVGLPVLGGDAPVEVWSAGQTVLRGASGPVRHARAGDLMLGCVHLPNQADDDPCAVTRDAYTHILSCLAETGYPYLLRMWNYLPAINAGVNGLERYKAFCKGRAEAFESLIQREGDLPAATAIGTRDGGLLIYFLAVRHMPSHLENPRQVSAFRYPPCYGPRSPSFARASLFRLHSDEADLFISGTASIVGHESRHEGDPEMQLQETLNNMEHLLDHAVHREFLEDARLHELALLKIYLRHEQDLATVQRGLRNRLGRPVPVLWLQGEICREELLVEIEGMYREVRDARSPALRVNF